ncbi:PHD finger protein 7-like isoform X2 [Hermetia illucens]|uniref:PHD finger protein 7-like isoform X2 n=1 Tax=Hermetia illucens TaxID=343691 RepID=UPI0018CC3ADC|nr:PHD finger protein 7-like isoform X2 [Hermetia illucens]
MCDICHKDIDDPVELGAIMDKSGIKVHYYCLLTSTHLPQRGQDNGGILGFLIADIKKEIKQCSKRTCCYCKESYAHVKCAQCDLSYHLACGLKNDCLFEFVDEFNSSCHQHHGIKHKNPHLPEMGCYICLTSMGIYNPLSSITSKCCDMDCWVHRRCLKEYALSAGYYLQCLWCKSKQFREDIRRFGIFVPDRDALWEREKGAFSELYEKYSRCDAVECLCEKGRNHHYNSGKWLVVVCHTCAMAGSHLACLPQGIKPNEFQCDSCHEILNRTKRLHAQDKVESQRLCVGASLDTTLFMSKSQRSYVDAHFSQHSNFQNRCLPDAAFEKAKRSPESPGSSKTEKFRPKLSGLKPYIILDPHDKSQFEYALLDSEKNIVERQKLTVNKNAKPDDDLIHKLVKNLQSRQKLHDEVIEVSDNDDSQESAGDLFDKLIKKSDAAVPKPKKLTNHSAKKSDQISESARHITLPSNSDASSLYHVSQPTLAPSVHSKQKDTTIATTIARVRLNR